MFLNMHIALEKMQVFQEIMGWNFNQIGELSLRRFLANYTSGSHGEYSVKIQHGKVYPRRVNFWHSKDCYSHYCAVRKFLLKKQGFKKEFLSKTVIDDFFLNFTWARCRNLIFGFDLRNSENQSRLKLWVDFCRYPQQVLKARKLASMEGYPLLKEWNRFHADALLVGFDSFRDGKVEPKIYPFVKRSDYRLGSALHPLFYLSRGIYMIHVSGKKAPVMHFHLDSSEYMYDIYGRMTFPAVFEKVTNRLQGSGFILKVVSIPYRQVVNKRVQDVTMYYR